MTALHQRRVDGVILAPSADPERRALAYLRSTRLPCVLVDRTPDPSFDQVGVNNGEAMRELVDYVAGLGHRRIGYIGGHPGFETTLERIVGYRNSIKRLGLSFDERYLVTGNASTLSAADATLAAALAARSADSDRDRQQYGDDRRDARHTRAGLERSGRHFDRRIRRFRVGRLLRAAPHACRSAMRGDRPQGGVSVDGADRRARGRVAHRAARRHAHAA